MTEFFDLYGDKLGQAIIVHLYFVFVSVFFGFIIAVVLGVLLSRIPRYAKVIMPIISIFQTIPGIVFIGILFLYIGMVPLTVIIALSIYAVFPILKNTFIGITEVGEQYKEAAKGCGMNKWQVLFRVEIPLALPAIIAGLRMSTVYTVSWAVLASMIGLGGLGEFIYIGVSTNNNSLIMAGAIPAAIIAIVLSMGIDFVQKCLIPRGLRGQK